MIDARPANATDRPTSPDAWVGAASLLLGRAKPSDIEADPFPHLVLADAMEHDAYDALDRAFPPMRDFVTDEQPPSNKRYNQMTRRLLANPPAPAPWADLARELTSQSAWSRLVELFGPHLRNLDTSAVAKGRPPDQFEVGRRGIDAHPAADLLLDLMIATNSPVRDRPSAVRGPHVDLPNKLFSALFYMRLDEDDSEGGELQLFRFRDGRPSGFRGYEVDPDAVECVKTIPYRRNLLVVFLNSIYAVHGVTPRTVTPHPRRFLCLIGQVEADLFGTNP